MIHFYSHYSWKVEEQEGVQDKAMLQNKACRDGAGFTQPSSEAGWPDLLCGSFLMVTALMLTVSQVRLEVPGQGWM